MKKRIPNLDFYIETSDFNCTSTPTETNIEVGDRFVTCSTRDGSGQAQTIKGSKSFSDPVTFNKTVSIIDSNSNLGTVNYTDSILDVTGNVNVSNNIDIKGTIKAEDGKIFTNENGHLTCTSLSVSSSNGSNVNLCDMNNRDYVVEIKAQPNEGRGSAFINGKLEVLGGLYGLEPTTTGQSGNIETRHGSILLVCVQVKSDKYFSVETGGSFTKAASGEVNNPVEHIYEVLSSSGNYLNFSLGLDPKECEGTFKSLHKAVVTAIDSSRNVFILAMQFK